MRKRTKYFFIFFFLLAALIVGAVFLLARKPVPAHIEYGISFSAPYVHELGLDERDVLTALIEDLGVRNFRLSAHWPLIEPQKDLFDFIWLDNEIQQVSDVKGSIILSVGRRLPRWPECHVPLWARSLTWEEQKAHLREYITTIVLRYKSNPYISYWQVENEPYLGVFASEFCGVLDEKFLDEEIALVRSLDPTRPILVTDSGNLGTWSGAYRRGDAFGTSVYVYFWNPDVGQFKSILPPLYYRVKEGLVRLLHGNKKTMLIELSLEPWLLEPVIDVPIDVQYSRMNSEKFDDIIEYARRTRYDTQYLWGGEWWYWLKEHGDSTMWDKGKSIFKQ